MPWTGDEDVGEVIIGPGSGHESEDPEDPRDPKDPSSRRRGGRLRGCCRDDHYRRLSIISIVCGLSCVGIIALKYSVKAKERQRHDPVAAAVFAQKAKKWSIVSIVCLFALLAAAPVLMALVSYLATLKD
ncbi:hypothetical protein NL108_018476 [Boleophthalmus pectinirostris]|uniref:transmembrane protein 265 n=1 Tax=Boleophthalmus pectinirostris TaxID=150288 RepID=UPI000A1C3C1C|nr:transmembrane protein 265 [Boleophthalmus pectinirostris]KAJ0058636.1 hypothetical protein NL108_018476 [Boleophthalmus pectinirostris]